MNGGKLALAGKPMRNAPTRCSARRSITALVKCVVPMTTAADAARIALRQQLGQGGANAGQHVDGGGGFDRGQDLGAVDQHGVGVGAADVDADAPHANTVT